METETVRQAEEVGRLKECVDLMVASHPYGFLVTWPYARLVAHLDGSSHREIWIGTSGRSRKARFARSGGTAAYAVEDRSRFGYAALYGPTSVVDDRHRLESFWTPSLAPFFPAGPLGGDFVLIRLEAERVELMSFADAVHPDPYGLKAAAIARTSDDIRWQLAGPRDDAYSEDECP